MHVDLAEETDLSYRREPMGKIQESQPSGPNFCLLTPTGNRRPKERNEGRSRSDLGEGGQTYGQPNRRPQSKLPARPQGPTGSDHFRYEQYI